MTVIIAHAPCMITTLPSWDRRNIIKNNTTFLCFPFSNFRYSLTLFSKFFASFPHGTCLLLVSQLYLAFDGSYHHLWAAIPNNSTRWQEAHLARRTGVSPSQLPFSKGLGPASNATVYRPQFGAKRRFTSWALPASVALTEGILVSFFSSA